MDLLSYLFLRTMFGGGGGRERDCGGGGEREEKQRDKWTKAEEESRGRFQEL